MPKTGNIEGKAPHGFSDVHGLRESADKKRALIRGFQAEAFETRARMDELERRYKDLVTVIQSEILLLRSLEAQLSQMMSENCEGGGSDGQ